MGPLESLRMGLVVRKSSDQRELSGPPVDLWEGEGGSYRLSSIKTLQQRGLVSFQVDGHREIRGEWAPGEGMEAMHPFTPLALCISSIWLFLS